MGGHVKVILALIGLNAIVLFFGNAQWGKWIYIFQAYHSPLNQKRRDLNGAILVYPPEDYTGIWKSWKKDGSAFGVHIFNNGSYDWNMSADGFGNYKGELKDGIFIGVWTMAKDGVVQRIDKWDGLGMDEDKNLVTIYNVARGIDRRKEFGISVD